MRSCRLSATGPAEAAHWQAVLDAGYEEDMTISNTKIGSCASRHRHRAACPGSQFSLHRHRAGTADLRNSSAGAVLPETVPRKLLAACCVRGCVLFVEHRAAGTRFALCQRWDRAHASGLRRRSLISKRRTSFCVRERNRCVTCTPPAVRHLTCVHRPGHAATTRAHALVRPEQVL